MSHRAQAARVRSVRQALAGAGVWLVVEFSVRRLGSAVLLTAVAQSAGEAAREQAQAAVQVGMAALAAAGLLLVFVRRARRDGLTAADLGYRWDGRAAAMGIPAATMLIAALAGTAWVDRAVFDSQGDGGLPRRLATAGPTVMSALLLGNGALAPVAEELAWRGYIQGRFVSAWGGRTGMAATAVLFAAKHVAVDLSFERATTLVVGAAAFGVIARRWGTVAATVAHVLVNATATLALIDRASESVPGD